MAYDVERKVIYLDTYPAISVIRLAPTLLPTKTCFNKQKPRKRYNSSALPTNQENTYSETSIQWNSPKTERHYRKVPCESYARVLDSTIKFAG